MHLRILKMIATSGFLTALECTKKIGRGSLPDPAGGAKEGEGKGRKRRRGDRGEEVGEGQETGEGKGRRRDARKRKGEGKGRRKRGRRGGGGKRSKNTPSVNSCIRPCRCVFIRSADRR